MLNFTFQHSNLKYHQQRKNYEKSLKYLNMGFTGMFSVETILKIIGFGVKVGDQYCQPSVEIFKHNKFLKMNALVSGQPILKLETGALNLLENNRRINK